jgi:TIR domain
MRVFVSYAQEDAQRIAPICQALAAWQLTYWAPAHNTMNAEQNTAIQQGLAQADIFLRMCTTYTPRSYWMTFEQTAFLSVQAEEYRQSGQIARKLINVILDKQYQRLPFDYADPMIDATEMRDAVWQKALYTAIFTPPV